MMRRPLLKRIVYLLCAIGFPALLTGCPIAAQKREPVGKVYYTFFDTVSYIYSYAGDAQSVFDARADAASALLESWHHRMDIYHEYEGINNLSTVNKNAGGAPVQVDRELIDFLLYAKELYTLTEGKMNVMLGAVTAPWHACQEAAADDPASVSLPDEETLRKAAAHTDIDSLAIDREACTVRITDPLARIDVGALGKGYATERAARLLEEMGAEGYVLNIGGNVRIIGHKPDGGSWRTGVKDPFDHENAYALILSLADTSCVTSGVYERFFVLDGVRYHHIIDPETRMPAAYFASVSVITKDSGLADALSTALFCMSREDGAALAQSLGGVEVLWILPDGTQKYTPGLESLITE